MNLTEITGRHTIYTCVIRGSELTILTDSLLKVNIQNRIHEQVFCLKKEAERQSVETL